MVTAQISRGAYANSMCSSSEDPRAQVKNQQASQDFSQRMESEFGCNQVSRLKGVLSGASVLHGDLTVIKKRGEG